MATPGKVFRLGTEGAAAVQRDFAATGAAGAAMGRKIADGAKSVPPALRALDTAAGEAKKSVEGLAGGAGALGKALVAMGPLGLAAAAGVGAAGAAFVGLQGAARGAANELRLLQGSATQSGVGVEFLQEMRAAAVALGRDVAVVEPALKTFAVRLGEISGGIGQASLQVLATVGISAEQVAGFKSAEDGLLQLSDALAKVDQATAFNVADKLGVVDLIPLLKDGSAGFQRLAADARSAGLIIDSDVVARAAQTAAEWDRAAAIIDVQLKQAALDAAPAFLELAKFAAEIAMNLGRGVDRFREIDAKRTDSLRAEVQGLAEERRRLLLRFGPNAVNGGDPDAIGANIPGEGFLSERLVPGPGVANRLARILREMDERNREIFERERSTSIVGGGLGARRPTLLGATGGAGVGAPANDPEIARLDGVVKAFDAATAARDAYADAQRRFPATNAAEIDATLKLEATIRDLEAARRKNVITSDEELASRIALARAVSEEEIADRRRAETLAVVSALVERTIEPAESYAKALRDLAAAHDAGAISAEEYARGQARALAQLQAAAPEVLDATREALNADVATLVGDMGATLESAIRSGQDLDREGLTAILAQFWRDVIFDAIVAQPLDDLKALAVNGLQTFVGSILDGVSARRRGGGLLGSLVGAVIGGFGGGGAGATAPGRAAGGYATGLTWVGERGRELVDLRDGARVYDAATSRAMMERTGAGASVTFAPVINAPGASLADIDAALRASEARFAQRFTALDRSIESRALAAHQEGVRRGFIRR